jgi:hypothetical protein
MHVHTTHYHRKPNAMSTVEMDDVLEGLDLTNLPGPPKLRRQSAIGRYSVYIPRSLEPVKDYKRVVMQFGALLDPKLEETTIVLGQSTSPDSKDISHILYTAINSPSSPPSSTPLDGRIYHIGNDSLDCFQKLTMLQRDSYQDAVAEVGTLLNMGTSVCIHVPNPITTPLSLQTFLSSFATHWRGDPGFIQFVQPNFQ